MCISKNATPFLVRLTNFGWEWGRFRTLPEAFEACKVAGFETTILEEGIVVGAWSPIGGKTEYTVHSRPTLVPVAS